MVLALDLIAAHHVPIDSKFMKVFHGQLKSYFYNMDHEDLRLAGFRACMALVRECIPVHAGRTLSLACYILFSISASFLGLLTILQTHQLM